VLPLPGSIRGGAAGKVVIALLGRGLIRGQVTDSFVKADAALNTIWRNEEDGRAVLLLVTLAGLEAVGVETESGPVAPTESAPAQSATEGRDEANSAPVAAVEPAPTAPMPGKSRPPAQRVQLLASPAPSSVEVTVSAGRRLARHRAFAEMPLGRAKGRGSHR
jgi:hypothetical protein